MKDETKKAVIAGVLIFTAIVVANYYLFVSNISQRIRQVKSEINRLEKRKAKALSLLRRMNELTRKKAELEKEIARLRELLPQTEDLPGLIRAIADLAHTSGIDLSRVELGKEVIYPEKHYASINIKVSFTSTYPQLMSFLKKVDSLDRLVKPYMLNVSTTEVSENPRLKVSGILQTYRYVESQPIGEKRRKR